jgi:hypothetical protein
MFGSSVAPLENQRQFINFCWKARRHEASHEGTLLHEPAAGTEALFREMESTIS